MELRLTFPQGLSFFVREQGKRAGLLLGVALGPGTSQVLYMAGSGRQWSTARSVYQALSSGDNKPSIVQMSPTDGMSQPDARPGCQAQEEPPNRFLLM